MQNIILAAAALLLVNACVSPNPASVNTLLPIPVLPAPPPPWPVPEGVIGYTPAQIIARLGAPSEDYTGANRIIDFQGRGCVLSVFFRQEATEWRAFEVMNILLSGDVIDPNPCYRSIIEPEPEPVAKQMGKDDKDPSDT